MNSIEELVLRLRAHLGIPDDTLLDVLDTLRRMKIAGIISDYRRDEDHVLADAVAMWDDSTRTIVLSDALWEGLEHADPEIRFTVFHEIGHAVLGHAARNRKIAGKRQFGRSIEFDEQEADDFALAFAIPLRSASNLDIYDADALAQQFGLSVAMAERRMISLQRYSKYPNRLEDAAEPEDNYAEAMGLMRFNTITWNS
ncbi:ImmA/IrrE family metallo-endopeptidase [Devosia sp.]|uniref:ImmA/IrrE family metallo-endopeptidase n=1 Tax=Devosia sp. TaxID=1871048 RepID=UPI0019E77E60|nr:ImmA/IrrE family metallo-endopeptidase [Devosia sp.]MBE0578877.1 ImmA/IrrE family metallo-endopeptidase [Devosia sp.]